MDPATVPCGLDPDVLEMLEDLGLACFAEVLVEAGVRCPGDLSVLSDNDFKDLGFNLVQRRKLQLGRRKRQQANAMEPLDSDGESVHTVAAGIVGARKSSLRRPSLRMSVEEPELPEEVPEAPEVTPQCDGPLAQMLEPRGPISHDLSKARRKKAKWWSSQGQRPLRLIFVRHGESEGNVNRKITATVPDHALHLTAPGRKQSLEAGRMLRELIGDETVKFVTSPYVRAQETLNGILQAWNDSPVKPKVRADVRIREQEYGNYDSPDIQKHHKDRKEFGIFYYRFPGGESSADCFDRASSFMESCYRSWQDNTAENEVIVSHGTMIKVILMRLFRFSIEDFETLELLDNCEIVVCQREVDDMKYSIAFTWKLYTAKDDTGLRRKRKSGRDLKVWSGDPDAPLVQHSSPYVECSAPVAPAPPALEHASPATAVCSAPVAPAAPAPCKTLPVDTGRGHGVLERDPRRTFSSVS